MSALPLSLLRLAVAAFFLLSAGYGVLNCSPFAWEMFVRPQLFAWLAEFVAWHHVWFFGAYALSLITIAPALDWRRRGPPVSKSARIAAAAYAIVMGTAAMWLLINLYLPDATEIWRGAAAGACLPAAARMAGGDRSLAVSSSVALGRRAVSRHDRRLPDRRHLHVRRVAFWLAHLLRAAALGDRSGGAVAWTLSAAWALTITSVVSRSSSP